MKNVFKEDKYAEHRKQMLETQIQRRGIKNTEVLKAMLKVKRHLFVPEKMRHEAYKDHPIPIGNGQTISQPYIVAFMTEKLDIKNHHKVLEVGTGCGYQTAILCELAKHVYTIELIEELGIKAGKILHELNYSNFTLKIDDAFEGWKEQSPFDRIMVTCAPSNIPERLIEQLTDTGKMIIPTGKRHSQELLFIENKAGKLLQKNILSVRFVPMKNKLGNEY
ncbi:MAG: protein-L-isoaspartate(D-aspartate) O-methyltransferase [Bacteroidales bacterium]|nr:protein-L-isoaspartate(D-aspartate) O-methyltransferase [Bacteroidales bacterium]